MALTKSDADSLKYDPEGPGQQVLWDSEGSGKGNPTAGFGLRCYPSGQKSFVLSYRTETGRTRLLTLGKYGPYTVDKARKKANKKLVEIDEGADPLAERRQEKKRGEKADTVKAFTKVYLELHAKPHRRSWKEDERRIEKYIIPALGHLALRDVKRSDVEALHAKIGAKAAVEANRVVQLLRLIFNKARAWPYLPDEAPNPAEMDRTGRNGIKAFKEQSRERWVLPSEMPKLLEAIGTEENGFVAAAFRLYLLVPLRKRELLSARWDHIDFEAREWRVPATKSGGGHVVPLSAPALAILEALPRYAGNPHVFPGHKKGSHLVNIDKNWRAVREKAGCEDVTIHDLRRSVGSWMATAGVSLQVIGQVLGHAPGDVKATAIYARLQRDAARAALEEHGERLLAVENGKPKEQEVDPVEERLRDLLDGENPENVANRLRELAAKLEGEQ